jgi:hypothetical protein
MECAERHDNYNNNATKAISSLMNFIFEKALLRKDEKNGSSGGCE